MAYIPREIRFKTYMEFLLLSESFACRCKDKPYPVNIKCLRLNETPLPWNEDTHILFVAECSFLSWCWRPIHSKWDWIDVKSEISLSMWVICLNWDYEQKSRVNRTIRMFAQMSSQIKTSVRASTRNKTRLQKFKFAKLRYQWKFETSMRGSQTSGERVFIRSQNYIFHQKIIIFYVVGNKITSIPSEIGLATSLLEIDVGE